MTETASLDLRTFIREIPDFPEPGIGFKDITPLLNDATAFRQTIDQMADNYRGKSIDAVVAAEARGFIFAAPLALALGIGFVPIRKPGKLPFDRHSHSYDLEYGSDTLEMHVDALRKDENVLVVDDLLATGGTVRACCEIVENCGAHIVECAFLIELAFLNAREKLVPYSVFSLIKYE